jgi:hypothetical protein
MGYLDCPVGPMPPRLIGRRRRFSVTAPALEQLAAYLKAEDCPELVHAAIHGELPFDQHPDPRARRARSPASSTAHSASALAAIIFGLLATRDVPFINVDTHMLQLAGHSNFADRREEVPAICERVAALLVGPSVPPVEAVVVDICGLPERVAVVDGWTLHPVTDPVMPVEFPGYGSDLSDLHGRARCALLVHPDGITDRLREPDDGDRVLSLPLLVLNLGSRSAVRAVTAYRLVPGREVGYDRQRSASQYLPGEVARWHPHPGTPSYVRSSLVLDAYSSAALPGFMRELGKLLQLIRSEHAKSYRRLLDAADRFLTLSYHRFEPPPAHSHHSRPFMHASDAAARLAGCAELLLLAGQKTDLTRTLSQRAAILVGRGDDARIGIHELAVKMYAMRSAYVHVGSLKAADRVPVDDLRELVRQILIGWIVLTALHGPDLLRILDAALLSTSLRDREIEEPLRSFWSACDAPVVSIGA